MIYIVTRDRTAQAGAEQTLQRFVVMMHEWFADHMELLGYGRKTFAYETEEDGTTPKINLMNTDTCTATFTAAIATVEQRSVERASCGFSDLAAGVVALVIAET